MVFDEIREILSDHFEISPDSIEESTDIYNDLGASELDMVDISMDIEDQYSVEVTEESLEEIRTVEDLVLFINENLD